MRQQLKFDDKPFFNIRLDWREKEHKIRENSREIEEEEEEVQSFRRNETVRT